MSNTDTKMEDIVSLAKRRGFIFAGSDVYGGISGFYDYGPLGVALKRNITNLWWHMFVESRDDMFGIDAAIIMNPKVWQASGHVDTFTDPLTTCKECASRFRADKIIDAEKYMSYIKEVLNPLYDDLWSNYNNRSAQFREFQANNELLAARVKEDYEQFKKLQAAGVATEVYATWLDEASRRLHDHLKNLDIVGQGYDYVFAFLELLQYTLDKIREASSYTGEFARTFLDRNVECPVCAKKSWTTPQRFNMMFKTNVGPVSDESSVSYLRPETAQGIFTNYKNVVDTLYPDLPFGLAQIGKAFRNEISPRDFIFRVRELEQMEIEYFVNPSDWEAEFEKWRVAVHAWLDALGLSKDKVHELNVEGDDLAHYSKRTIDFEYDFPIGREELLGLAYRTDFDLMNIQNNSGKSMEYTVKGSNERFVPHVIEPSFGVERALMAVLSEAYTEDEVNGEKRVYLKLPEHLAPVKYCVSPLLKNKPELVAKAREVYEDLRAKHGAVMWDDNGNIGKRYRRQDEIGTPYCVVIDFDTLEDGTVTVRDRDTTEQARTKISEII